MFSNNKKISGRQAFRLLTYDFMGPGTLLVPTVLSGLAGRDGIFSIFAGLAAALLYLWLLGRVMKDMDVEYPLYLERKLGKLCGRFVLGGYLLYFTLLAGYTAYLFSGIVLKNLLREESFFLVLALILLLTAYGIRGGIESRARVYEILFWFLMIPLILMLLSAAGDVRTDYWFPVFTAASGNVFSGGYYVFQSLSLVFLVLFLKSFVGKRGTLVAAGRKALLFTGGVHVALYLVLLGVFGAAALGEMDFAAITLMSTVKISGGFIKRADAFMFGIWFFTLYALLGSTTFYGSSVLFYLAGGRDREHTGKQPGERIAAAAVLVAAAVLAVAFYWNQDAAGCFQRFLWYAGTPFLVLVPLVLAVCAAWKPSGGGGGKVREKKAEAESGKKLSAAVLPLLMICLTAGCTPAELEDRNFPIEIAIDDTDRFDAEWLNAAESGNRVIDYSHLKVILIGREFLTDDAQMQEFLDLLERKSDVPRNTYIVAADRAADLMNFSGPNGESAGEYIEELLENVSEVNKRAFPTLGMLYQEQENRVETLLIPYLGMDDKKPVVDHYFAWKRGHAAGDVDNAPSLLSFFTANQTESFTLTFPNADIRLVSPHNRVSFREGENREIIVDVRCTGEVIYEREETGFPDLERQIEAYMNETAARALIWQQIDLSGSYRKLGRHRRDLYRKYTQNPESYESDMKIVYHVQVKWSTVS